MIIFHLDGATARLQKTASGYTVHFEDGQETLSPTLEEALTVLMQHGVKLTKTMVANLKLST